MLKRTYLKISVAILSLIVIGLFIRFIIGGNEDSWIKEDNGVWVKHGNPSETPSEVLEQQDAITCALGKFGSFSEEKSSQCLGTCGDYAVDLVHVPRTTEDNLEENQCSEYALGNVSHFIEFDEEGDCEGGLTSSVITF